MNDIKGHYIIFDGLNFQYYNNEEENIYKLNINNTTKNEFQNIIDSGKPIRYLNLNRVMLANLQTMFNCIISYDFNFPYIFSNNCKKSDNDTIIEINANGNLFIFKYSSGAMEAALPTKENIDKVARALINGVIFTYANISRVQFASIYVMLSSALKNIKGKDNDLSIKISSKATKEL